MSDAQPFPPYVRTRDGRRLRIEVSGDPLGQPVVLMHGTPGSRLGPRPLPEVLTRLGVLLISYDRPGYGESTCHPGRSVASAATDVADIADGLGLRRFSVVGRSGGGPHALACAALLPDRVVRAAVLVSVAPADAEDLDWYEGMTAQNVADYRAVDERQLDLIEELTARVRDIQRDPEELARLLDPALQGADRRVMHDFAMRSLFTDSYAEAVREGPDGWIDDTIALRGRWGFDLRAIGAPVRLWHGHQDQFSPVHHTHWLASRIPTATVEVEPWAGHFGAVEVLPDILQWAAAEPDDAPVQG